MNKNNPQYTKHAERRCNQRGVPQVVVDFIISYGDCSYTHKLIKHYINRKDCPVKNHFLGLPKWSREDAVKAFDTYLWSQHQKDAIEKPLKDWFNARVKELMAGHNLDLIDDIDFVKGNDDSHGFTLKNYIEYLAKEIY